MTEHRRVMRRDIAIMMAVSLAVWLIVALVDVSLIMLLQRGGEARPPRIIFLGRAIVWLGWWLMTPGIFYAARRFHFQPGRRLQSLWMHAAAAVVAAFLVSCLMVSVAMALRAPLVPLRVRLNDIITYAAVCGVAISIDLLRRERAHAITNAQLEAQLAKSRMQALTAQLRPHFLYNALNGVAMQIRANENSAALASVLGYSRLLRHVLDADAGDVPLRNEIAFVNEYLAIERMRFPDTLDATVSASPQTEDALVPNLILQPLVENALHHGLADVEAGARLEVTAILHDDMIRIEVRDNGAGLPPGWSIDQGTGVGLRNTRSRLRERYGDAHHFELHSPPEGGTVVIIEMPYSAAGSSAYA